MGRRPPAMRSPTRSMVPRSVVTSGAGPANAIPARSPGNASDKQALEELRSLHVDRDGRKRLHRVTLASGCTEGPLLGGAPGSTSLRRGFRHDSTGVDADE